MYINSQKMTPRTPPPPPTNFHSTGYNVCVFSNHSLNSFNTGSSIAPGYIENSVPYLWVTNLIFQVSSKTYLPIMISKQRYIEYIKQFRRPRRRGQEGAFAGRSNSDSSGKKLLCSTKFSPKDNSTLRDKTVLLWFQATQESWE